MFFNFYLKTKIKKKVKIVFNFFFYFLLNNLYDIIYLNSFSSKSKKYFLSLLKSHFVYKSSQEQLGFTQFKSFFNILSLKSFFFSWVLSKINSILFQSNFIKQFLIVNFNSIKTFYFKTLIFNNFITVSKLSKPFLNILDFYGENILTNPLNLKL